MGAMDESRKNKKRCWIIRRGKNFCKIFQLGEGVGLELLSEKSGCARGQQERGTSQEDGASILLIQAEGQL